jgi:predicted ATPase/class 3 adenylate cyclase
MSSTEPALLRQQLEQAIAAQEGLRGTLDDAIIDVTLAALRKQLAELSAAPDAVEQQRKLVTVLFMDIVGSTALVRDLDPEESMAIMDTALQRLAEPVAAHGGKVTRFMGDGFLAVYGLPRARENDPQMAVRAGLEIVETSRAIAQDLERERGLAGFQVRVGVNTGLIVAGGVTEAEGTIMGAAVNLAARLESAAPPGGVLISQQTYQHVRGIFDLEPGEAIQAKGFVAPVQVYRVQGAKARAFRMMTRGVEGVETRMIGRDAELGQLRAAFERVVQGQGRRFVLIVGEAGLGKSRLLEEFERWLDRQPAPFTVFRGRATLESVDLPYGLWRDLVAARFGILDDDSVATVRSKLVRGFRRALGDGDSVEMKAHFTGQLLGYDFHDSPYLQGVLDAPQQLRDRALVYLLDYFRALAARQPVVVFLDDIHWADDSSLDVARYLSRELAHQPALFVALTRPTLFERRPAWNEGFAQRRLALRPLTRQESERLVGEVLHKVQDLPDVLRDLVAGSAEGNPFYLEELVKMLVEDGVIVKSEPRWQVHRNRLAELRVPPTLTGVIQARLDGLPAEERAVLQQASVVGRVFWDAAVQYVNRDSASPRVGREPSPWDINPDLDALEDREMIFQRGTSAFSDAAEYGFKHAILRDVTYESVLIRVRKVYHGLVADWLITHSGERADEFSGLIAGHLERAGREAEALAYLSQAAAAAAAKHAVNEAADFYARALALTPEEDLEGRYHLLLGREKLFGAQGNPVAQREALASLEALADALGDAHKRAEVWLRQAWFAIFRGEFSQGLAVAQRAVTLAEAVQDRGLVGQANYAVAWTSLQLADPDRVLVFAGDALRQARQAHDRRAEGNTLNILGLVSTNTGEYAAARDYLQGFLAIARELGDLEREVTALNNLGVALTCLGDFQSAQSCLEHMLHVAAETGDRFSEGSARLNLAWVASARGDWEAARAQAEASVAMKREFEQMDATAEALVWLGHAWLGLGNPDEAIAAYGEALTLRRELDQPHLEMGALAGLAQAALANGDVRAAQGYVGQIMAYLDAGGTLQGSWEPLRIYLTCFQVLQAAGDGRADGILEEAYRILQEQAARIPGGADRQRFLHDVPWHRAILSAWEGRGGGH